MKRPIHDVDAQRARWRRYRTALKLTPDAGNAFGTGGHRIAGTYRSGPFFLAGDAAHTHSPAGGQGMNTGIQDATNLGWKLAFAAHAEPAPDRCSVLLDSYDRERRPVARRVIGMTNAVFWAEAGTDPLARAVRKMTATVGPLALPSLLRRRRLLAAGVRILGQLRVHYRHSPLSVNGPQRPKHLPCAGDRLPDATVTTPDGPTRLHDLTARGHPPSRPARHHRARRGSSPATAPPPSDHQHARNGDPRHPPRRVRRLCRARHRHRRTHEVAPGCLRPHTGDGAAPPVIIADRHLAAEGVSVTPFRCIGFPGPALRGNVAAM
jgi:hypothetical protein